MTKSFFTGDKHDQEPGQSMKNYWRKAKDKCADFMDDVKSDPKLEGAFNLARTHTKETFFIILMGVGILISFFHFIGGFLVGAVATLCLPWDVAFVWKRISEFYDQKGQFKTVILGLVGLFLLLHVPSLLIGAALGLALNLFLKTDVGTPAREGVKKSLHELENQFQDTKSNKDQDS